MSDNPEEGTKSLALIERWCKKKGDGWSVGRSLGQGGTAPVFEVNSPDGILALKLYDVEFSSGQKGEIEERRIDQQLELRGHDCPYLVQVLDGGRFEDRLFLLMSRAPGTELEKRLQHVPRTKIRSIVDQVARAAIFLREKSLCHRDIKSANIYISEDFQHSTLLDISVIRDISDPVGLGTDHDGQLPVVATARYSPPEYLFRLVKPGPDLWHALNIYQMGALLHDLIMREPLFQAEYMRSFGNRYRFAWVISTIDPSLQVDDVDRDLLFTARRALDKDWQRRSLLKLEDFLADSNIHEANALKILGIGIAGHSTQDSDNAGGQRRRVRELSSDLEARIVQHFKDRGLRAEHRVQAGTNDISKVILLHWEAPTEELETPARQAYLQVTFNFLHKSSGNFIGLFMTLVMHFEANEVSASLQLPEMRDDSNIEATLFALAIDSLGKLAVEVSQVKSPKSEA